MRVRWLGGATRSLRAVHAHIAVDNREAANQVVVTINRTVTRLQVFPESGRLGHVAGTRELVVPRFPYIVVYRLTETEVQILRVLHGASDWQSVTQ